MVKFENKDKAFTLIEIMVAIAIVSIMSAVVLVSLQGFGAKARASKALAELSSAIPSMVSCWGNGGNVVKENGNGTTDMCSLSSSYGKWPANGGDLSSYTYSSSAPSGGNFDKSSWYVQFRNDTDKKGICCNSAMNNCVIQDKTTVWSACTASDPIN